MDRGHRNGRTHSVTLNSDWSVTTPHDLEAERVGAGLGGYLSCLELVDKVIPAVQVYVRRQLRGEFPRLSLGNGGRWRSSDRIERCCAATTDYRGAVDAAKHIRSARHIAAEFGARTTTVASLGKTLLLAHGHRDPVAPPVAMMSLVGRCLRRPSDVYLLWEAGLPPEYVERVHAHACDERIPPASFYLGVMTNRPDLRWVHRTAAQVPDIDVHDWLAWSETTADLVQPNLRGDWLRLGVSQRDVPTLSNAGYLPASVDALARGLAMTATRAAATLASWVMAGCAPEVEVMISVCRSADAGPSLVTRESLDRLAELLRPLLIEGTRDQLAYALALCGSPYLASSVVSLVLSLYPEDITRGLQEWEEARRSNANLRGERVDA